MIFFFFGIIFQFVLDLKVYYGFNIMFSFCSTNHFYTISHNILIETIDLQKISFFLTIWTTSDYKRYYCLKAYRLV